MSEFSWKYDYLLKKMMDHGEEVHVGQWQSQDISEKPEMVSRELRHETFTMDIPQSSVHLAERVKPNLPWAEDHFLERVSGQPLNPPPSEAWWPFRVQGNAAHKHGEIFSHTYPERMWPKYANIASTRPNGRQVFVPHNGIRYELGDLDDLVDQLAKNIHTRQAYLPIWFPEDTGAVDGQRVPCTLGYHFLGRQNKMEIVYYIRSCDLLRHFADDVYMAGRLLQWVVGKLGERSINIYPSRLIMHISSLHVFRGDYPRIERMIETMEEEETQYGAAV